MLENELIVLYELPESSQSELLDSTEGILEPTTLFCLILDLTLTGKE